ncbi:MAG: glycosyltransferase [Proteobacteria bacterium]|nr:glycosyltransferase [Pseudomonadota bacterium]
MAVVLLAAVPLAIWTYLWLGRGAFWSARLQQPPAQLGPARVVAVIPARNEAATIGATVGALLAQQFHGELTVVVVDDGSTDGTAAVAGGAAGTAGAAVAVINGSCLPPGWTGKLWALNQGVDYARSLQPDFLLFTDADIEHAPRSLAGLLGRAQHDGRDLVSRMVRLATDTWSERLLIPAFVFFFFMLYPPAWAASSRRRLAAAAGGCVLIRPQILARIGGLQSIRARIIDDCSLAQAVKDAGGRIWLELTQEARSLRGYGSPGEIAAMISRTAFAQLRHSYLLLALTLLGLVVTYVLPVGLLLAPDPRVQGFGLAAWALMSALYLPMVRFYGLGPLWCLALPGVACFYAVATVESARQYARGQGGQWKGRAQDPAG